MRNTSILTVALVWLTAAAAIAGEGTTPKPAAPPAGMAAPTKKIDWEKMSQAQRKKYMKTTVLPAAKKLFSAFDPKKYKNVTCMTCHGDQVTDGKFKMPNPQLPKLPAPTDMAGFQALQQKKPEVTKFMGTQVKPTIAALLGHSEWSPANPTGFGCYGCHTQEGEMGGAKPTGAAGESPGMKSMGAAKNPATGKPAAPGEAKGW